MGLVASADSVVVASGWTAPTPRCWDPSLPSGQELEVSCCRQQADCAAPAFAPLRAACCGELRQGVQRFSAEWDQLELGIEHASEELIGIVEATSASRCEEQENCRADFFLYAAEVATSSSLARVFQLGWSDLTDEGEFALQDWRITLLQTCLTLLSAWHPLAQKARELFSEAAGQWWQAVQQRSAARWTAASLSTLIPSRILHIAMVASVGAPPFGRKALAGIRSALFFASCPLRFHLMVDQSGEADVQTALASLEPWLLSRGSFRLYRVEELHAAWSEIRALVPESCLQYSSHYGSAGWLRVFPHLVIPEAEAVEELVWVDAGDFIFLDDPAELAKECDAFHEDHLIGVADPQVLGLPLQLFLLPRLRERAHLWAELVTGAVLRGYAEKGDGFCNLGEGLAFVYLLNNTEHSWMYHLLPHRWTYMPWAVWLPARGTGSIWASQELLWRLPADSVWRDSVFPGLLDFMAIRVRCASFLEDIASYIRAAMEWDLQSISADNGRKHFRLTQDAQIVDEFQQSLACEERASAVHFAVLFHQVPWVHRFLNFWAGAEASVLQRRGEKHRKLGDLQKALADFNAALAVDEHFAGALIATVVITRPWRWRVVAPSFGHKGTCHSSMLPPWLLAACAVPIVLVLYKSIDDGIFTGSTAAEDEKLRAYLEKLEAANDMAEVFLNQMWDRALEAPVEATAGLTNFTVITVDTDKPRDFAMLGPGNVAVINAGAGQMWDSWYDKPRLYQKYLKKFAVDFPDRIVILADGYDTIFGGCSDDQLLASFRKILDVSQAKVVWGAENCCFPWSDACNWYRNFTQRQASSLQAFGITESYGTYGDCRRCRDLEIPGYDSFCSSPPTYQHLNSGFLMGEASHVLSAVNLWVKLYSNFNETDPDQLVASEALFNQPDLMTLDYSGRLVLTIGNIALDDFDKAVSLEPNSAQVRIARAIALRDQGEMEKALRTLNEDMDPLFEKFMPIFDQDVKEFLQQGETHEQYAAYREYVASLEEHASDFALQEGYSPGDAGSFLSELQRAIEEDKVRAEKQVEAFLVHMEQQRRMRLGPEAPPMEQGEVDLMKALFRPQTVEDMMEMLLHMTEYTSFSSLMRAKVQQKKFIREMERRKQDAKAWAGVAVNLWTCRGTRTSHITFCWNVQWRTLPFFRPRY
ncbi:unnamed protein product [Symbiodinium sp. CCMP2456]|nr:unnamed protein product [Symbiodinium sp. CCMP2456]